MSVRVLVHDVCKREIGSREEFIEDDYDYGQSESSVRFFLDKLSNSSNNNVIHPDIGISSFPFYCEIVDIPREGILFVWRENKHSMESEYYRK